MVSTRFVLFSYCVLLLSAGCNSANVDCGLNELFANCIQAVCRHQECKAKVWSIGCPIVAKGSCQKGCICKKGYLRDEIGVCVPEDECKRNPCQPNEEWSNCTQTLCRPLECAERGKEIVCKIVPDEDCISGCVCQTNFLKSYFGCVPENECPYYE